MFTKEEIFYIHSGSPVGCGETVKVTCHGCVSAYARSVFVWFPGRQRILMICEFEVYTEGKYESSISLKVNIWFEPYRCRDIISSSISDEKISISWANGMVPASQPNYYTYKWWRIFTCILASLGHNVSKVFQGTASWFQSYFLNEYMSHHQVPWSLDAKLY